MKIEKRELKVLLSNWQSEKESALLYCKMAREEADKNKKQIYRKLARVENEHARLWKRELKKRGINPVFRRSIRMQCLLTVGEVIGYKSLVNILEKGERATVLGYFKQTELFSDTEIQKNLKEVIPVEKRHSSMLLRMSGKTTSALDGERWHTGGGSIRDVIFGMNDGLLSTFSLITGVAGGGISNSVVLLAGLAGAIAGAISMAAGAFVSTRAEQEVMEKHLALERKELEVMPETEARELALLYELKGIEAKQAQMIADQIMSNKEIALETMAREELGFSPSDIADPKKAALVSGIAFIIGSAVPVLPFLITAGTHAFTITIIASLSGFFIIGAGRTIVTGKNAFRSGLEMFTIGMCAAAITYLIGKVVGNFL